LGFEVECRVFGYGVWLSRIVVGVWGSGVMILIIQFGCSGFGADKHIMRCVRVIDPVTDAHVFRCLWFRIRFFEC